MKEITYGWYPSIKNIYRPKGRPSSQHLECLYNFKNYQGQAVSHEPELFVRGVSSATPTSHDLKQKTKYVQVPKFLPDSKMYIPTPTQCWAKNKTLPETHWGVVDSPNHHTPSPPSEVKWPLHEDGKQQKYQQQFLKTHIQHQPDTYSVERNQCGKDTMGFQKSNQNHSPSSSEDSSVLTWPAANKSFPLRPKSSYCGQPTSRQEKRVKRPSSTPGRPPGHAQRDIKSCMIPSPPSVGNTSPLNWHERIQSATVFREKTHLPARPGTASIAKQSVLEQELVFPHSHDFEPERPPTRPAAPIPFASDDSETVCELEEAMKSQGSPSPEEDDYDKIVDKYGWRAQIHGDPYQLKKPMKRESYTVKCSVPELLSAPPVVHMESKETFFYNTIPNKPMSFSVDKEWMSEVLLAKRLELQRREGGIKYAYKNFAFVY